MVTILVTGHGNFATGLLSASQLISGTHDKVCAVDFAEGSSTDDLRADIGCVVNSGGEDILILTDIAGGSPYNISVMLKTEHTNKRIEVVSGANIPMLISAILERGEESPLDVAESIVETGTRAIKRFQRKKIQEIVPDEGI